MRQKEAEPIPGFPDPKENLDKDLEMLIHTGSFQ